MDSRIEVHMPGYIIGLEFSTLSAKAILVDAEDGKIEAVSMCGYHDAVIDRTIPGTTKCLPRDTALQDPQNYVDSLEILLREVWRKTGVQPEEIIAIGVGITACTLVTLDEHKRPLCFQKRYRDNPHSWVKLWKHQGAKDECKRINDVATERNESFIHSYGGRSTSEWMFAKIYETLNKAPEIYEAAHRFMEMGDYLVYLLTGNVVKSSCLAGYKAFWNAETGYPSKQYFAALDARLENVVDEKIGNDPIVPMGTWAGKLCHEWAQRTGLSEDTLVSVAGMDAHLSVPAAGADCEGSIVMTIDSSICHLVVDRDKYECPGICGVVRDGILTGSYGYEAGKVAAGNILDWFVEELVPYTLVQRAIDEHISIYSLMDRMAAGIPAGGTGLLALDWWSGNQSIDFDLDLSGVILGMTLKTKPEEIYRALMEGIAYGARETIDSMKRSGIKIERYYATGGLAQKSDVLLQIMADVLGVEVMRTDVAHTAAMGAAIYASVAAGHSRSVVEAIRKMTRPPQRGFQPNMSHHAVYDKLFAYYLDLCSYFKTEEDMMMHAVKQIKRDVSANL